MNVSFTFDVNRLQNLPWSVWPETTGPKAVIRDACNEVVAEIKANSRQDMLEIGRFIEEATSAALRGNGR